MSGLEVGAAGGEQRAVFISGLVKKLGSSTGECCMITGLSGSPVEFGVSAGEEGVSGGLRVGEWV